MYYIDWLLTVTFLGYVFLSIKNNPAIILGSILIINICLEAISINFVEAGAFNIELGMVTYRQGITIPLLFYLFIFYYFFAKTSTYTVLDNNYSEKLNSGELNRNRYPTSYKFILYFPLILILLEIIGLSIYGVPLYSGVSRIVAAKSNKIAAILGGSASYISLMCGFLFFIFRKKIGLYAFILHLILLILQAHKFTAIIQNSIAFFSISLVQMSSIEITKKQLIAFTVSLILIIGVFYLVYSRGNQFSNDLGLSTFQAMGYRAFYLVSHTFWGMHFYYDRNFIDPDITTFFDSARNMVRFMNPDPNIEESISRGATFGMAFPGYLYFIAPPIIFPVFAMVFGSLSGYCINILRVSLSKNKFILSIISYVLMNHFQGIIIQGNFYKIISAKSFFILFVIVFYFLIVKIHPKKQIKKAE